MERAFKEFIGIPEKAGVVMVIEKEFGPWGVEDWVKIAQGIASIVKITFGTAALYSEDILREKLRIYREANIQPMVGGTLTEVAILSRGGYTRKDLQEYLSYIKKLGFTYLEFSDGSIFIPEDKRREIIKLVREAGLRVISEVGKKDPKKDALLTMEKRIELMKKDLDSGSEMVIIEARESGKGIGVMDKEGKIDFRELDSIIKEVGLEKTMIEAPEKNQQQAIFMRYGPQANIGNVQPRDILSVGALRAGLRGDTIMVLRKEDWKKYHESQKAPKEYLI